jgi:hypothetical protein
MTIIKTLSEYISEEIGDAEKYMYKALQYAELDPELSKTFYKIANQEVEHAKALHGQAVRLIEQVRQSGVTPPPGMLEIYEHMHDDQIARFEEFESLLKLYKGDVQE